jgi:hypothetical protein
MTIDNIKEIHMKKMFFLAMLSAISTSYCAHGIEGLNKANYTYAHQQYGKETVDSIHVNGRVILEGTKILGLVQVNGSLQAKESAIHSLQINGQSDLHNCVVTNTTTINGSLNADHTKFQNALSVASEKIVLERCTVDSLTVRKVQGYTGTQVVDLRDGTKIIGPITVESGNGEIWISSNSEISEAQVSGALVFRK